MFTVLHWTVLGSYLLLTSQGQRLFSVLGISTVLTQGTCGVFNICAQTLALEHLILGFLWVNYHVRYIERKTSSSFQTLL